MKLKRVRTTAIGLAAAFVAASSLIPAQADARTHRRDGNARMHHYKVQPWHGWANGGFYLDGVRHPGGNPRGFASALNNWEGGFHPKVFWMLQQHMGG